MILKSFTMNFQLEEIINAYEIKEEEHSGITNCLAEKILIQ